MTQHKKYTNKLNNTIKLAKKYYYEKQFTNYKKNSRMTWKTINDILNKKTERSKIPQKFIENNSTRILTEPN